MGFVNAQRLRSVSLRVRLPYVGAAPRRLDRIDISCAQFSTTSPDSSVGYRWIDGVERLEMYEPGGYHPVLIDDVLQDRYQIVDKLGFGGYSTIWLARDEVEKRYVAVKIGISSPSLPRREPEILRALHHSTSNSQNPAESSNTASSATLPTTLDAFDIHGPNGTQPCYTLTPAQGNLKEASFSRLFPIQVARALSANLAIAVAAVHSRGFVHGGPSWSMYSKQM